MRDWDLQELLAAACGMSEDEYSEYVTQQRRPCRVRAGKRDVWDALQGAHIKNGGKA